jgi:CBS domain-containing protein
MLDRTYRALAESRLHSSAGYHLPDPTMATPVRPQSPAVEVMTDLRRVAAVTAGPDVSINEANQTMIRHGVRSLIVTDNRRRVLGILTANDVLGERPMQVANTLAIRYAEVVVRDIMTPAERLDVIALDDVLNARVGDVLATLQRSGRQHALAVDQSPDGAPMVRGIFSATQIARQLGIEVPIAEVARTFAEIEAAIGA